MLGGAARGATPARAGVRPPRRSRAPNRETIRGMDHGSNSDRRLQRYSGTFSGVTTWASALTKAGTGLTPSVAMSELTMITSVASFSGR